MTDPDVRAGLAALTGLLGGKKRSGGGLRPGRLSQKLSSLVMTPAGSALKGDGPRDEKGENGQAAAGRDPEGGTLLSQGQHPEEYS